MNCVSIDCVNIYCELKFDTLVYNLVWYHSIVTIVVEFYRLQPAFVSAIFVLTRSAVTNFQGITQNGIKTGKLKP